MGHQVSQAGAVSALCFRQPRAINMRSATWTSDPQAVSCPKCLAILATKKPEPQADG